MPPQIPTRQRQVMAHKILQQSREAENALADALITSPTSSLVGQSPTSSNGLFQVIRKYVDQFSFAPG